ncbi:hypothetical protein kuro4_00990 [Gelria sp. Kuro-4]|nr:hypothetical protein kuro4_00990 [Gelria sp. Kuro-4]
MQLSPTARARGGMYAARLSMHGGAGKYQGGGVVGNAHDEVAAEGAHETAANSTRFKSGPP